MRDLTPPNPLSGFFASGAVEASPFADAGVDCILNAVRLHLGMEIAFASRFIDGRREFTHLDADIPLPVTIGDSEPLKDTLCQRILDGRLPELIHDASDYAAARELPITAALPIGSHLNVPLRLGDGRIYGTFCCISREPDRSLTQRDISTLRAFADLAANQIERRMKGDRERNEVLARIDSLIERDGLTIFHQPIHRLSDGAAVGVECLARFADEAERPPSDWFDEAASVGRGVELEMLAVRQALRGLPYIPAELYMSINASPETVLSGALDDALANVEPGRIVIELTEHARVTDYDALRTALEKLRDRARIAIDDVGAGYSGLRHIVDLRPDILKLDISLTRHVDLDHARRALTQAMVAFAESIGSAIIAEGVETEGERKAMAGFGVPCAQGYLFSRPMPVVVAQQFLLASMANTDVESVERGLPEAARENARRRYA